MSVSRKAAAKDDSDVNGGAKAKAVAATRPRERMVLCSLHRVDSFITLQPTRVYSRARDAIGRQLLDVTRRVPQQTLERKRRRRLARRARQQTRARAEQPVQRVHPGFFDDDLVSEVSAAASDAAAAAVSETLGPTCRAASSAACTYRLARSLGRDDGGGDAVPPRAPLGVSATGDWATASIAPGGASSRARSSSRAACCSPGVSGGWIESLARGWIASRGALRLPSPSRRRSDPRRLQTRSVSSSRPPASARRSTPSPPPPRLKRRLWRRAASSPPCPPPPPPPRRGFRHAGRTP